MGDGGSLLYIGDWMSEHANHIFAFGGGGSNEEPGYNFYQYNISSNNWIMLKSISCPIGFYVGNRLGYANGPYTGIVDFPVIFKGTGSYDPDGTITSYEWDLDGDGEFDDATGPEPSKTWNYTYSGTISLKVTDNDGIADINSITVTVEENPILSCNISLSKGWNLISAQLNLTTWELGNESIVCNPLNVTPENSLTSIYRYNTTTGSFEKCDYFDNWGWSPATGSKEFTRLEPGRGYWVMATNECVWRHKI